MSPRKGPFWDRRYAVPGDTYFRRIDDPCLLAGFLEHRVNGSRVECRSRCPKRSAGWNLPDLFQVWWARTASSLPRSRILRFFKSVIPGRGTIASDAHRTCIDEFPGWRLARR